MQPFFGTRNYQINVFALMIMLIERRVGLHSNAGALTSSVSQWKKLFNNVSILFCVFAFSHQQEQPANNHMRKTARVLG